MCTQESDTDVEEEAEKDIHFLSTTVPGTELNKKHINLGINGETKELHNSESLLIRQR